MSYIYLKTCSRRPNYKRNRLIIITGQTATGKTNLALDYAHKYNGELINCDSRQIYKKLDIITGKDLPLISTRLWLYDIIDPKQYFSSYDYTQCALFVIKDILKRGKTPIIVGGSGYYLRHLLYGFPSVSIPPNWPLRKQLEKKVVSELQSILQKLISRASDQSFQPPVLKMNNSDFNNPRRLIRRIEILSSPSPKTPNLPNLPNLPIDYIGLKYKNKEDLINAIQTRVEKRLKQGAVEEVKKILQQGYTENDPGLKTIGYQQIIQYLKGKLTKQQAVDQWITREIQYAKRQITYLKKYFDIKWKEV